MSPPKKVEVEVFLDIAATLRQWAAVLEQLANEIQEQPVGRPWGEHDLTELYQAWLHVGQGIRDVARSQPDVAPEEVRAEVAAVRDGLNRITEILSRNAPQA